MEKVPEFIQFINNDDIIFNASLKSQNPPKVLYHYTNTDGLKGIIDTGLFYASHFLYFLARRSLSLTTSTNRFLDIIGTL